MFFLYTFFFQMLSFENPATPLYSPLVLLSCHLLIFVLTYVLGWYVSYCNLLNLCLVLVMLCYFSFPLGLIVVFALISSCYLPMPQAPW